MEWQLKDARKTQYDSLLKSAQETDSNIGMATYRIHKLNLMRDDVDKAMRTWWEEVQKELNLDMSQDYIITNDGRIEVAEKQPGSKRIVASKPAQPEIAVPSSTIGRGVESLI